MKKTTVSIISGNDPVEQARSAIETAGIVELIRDKRVFLKLNFGGPGGKKGAIISEGVTRGVLETIKPLAKELVLGEQGRATSKDSWDLVDRIWARRLFEEMGVKYLNLWDVEYDEIELKEGLARKKWRIPRIILESDVVGSLAALKVSAAASVTLCMKNIFGILPIKNKAFLHGKIHEVILDLFRAIKPGFGIIDGVYGWEGGESAMGGSPVTMNLVLASRDIVALDAVASAVMGFDPEEVKHIRMAGQMGLGVSKLNEIKVVGDEIEKVMKRFKRVPTWQALGSRLGFLAGLVNWGYMLFGEE